MLSHILLFLSDLLISHKGVNLVLLILCQYEGLPLSLSLKLLCVPR